MLDVNADNWAVLAVEEPVLEEAEVLAVLKPRQPAIARTDNTASSRQKIRERHPRSNNC